MMFENKNGGTMTIWSRLITAVFAVMVMLGMSLGVASASGDDDGAETPIVTATPTAEPTDDSVAEVPEVDATEVDSAAKGEKPETKPTKTPKPTSTATVEPTEDPSVDPTEEPTEEPTKEPTEDPTKDPTEDPTEEPTEEPTVTATPTDDPDPVAPPLLVSFAVNCEARQIVISVDPEMAEWVEFINDAQAVDPWQLGIQPGGSQTVSVGVGVTSVTFRVYWGVGEYSWMETATVSMRRCVTPTPEPSEEPSPTTPPTTVEPTDPPSGKPTVEPTSTPTPTPTPTGPPSGEPTGEPTTSTPTTGEPTKAPTTAPSADPGSDKSDPKGPAKTGVIGDDSTDTIWAGAALAAIMTSALVAVRMKRRPSGKHAARS